MGTRPNGFTLEPMSDEDWKRLVVTEEALARMALTITPARCLPHCRKVQNQQLPIGTSNWPVATLASLE